MSSEKQPWDGEDRRTSQAPEGLTALHQATRSAEAGMPVRSLYTEHEDPNQNHVRENDFRNKDLRKKVEALLEIATSGGKSQEPAPVEADQSPAPAENTSEIKESRELSPEEAERVLQSLLERSKRENFKILCPTIDWARAERALRETPEALWTVHQAREHEPVIFFADETGIEIGSNLCIEFPQSTRNCVGHKQAAEWMEQHHPNIKFNSDAETQAENMGWGLMTIEKSGYFIQNTPLYYEQGFRYYHTPDDIKAIGYPEGPGRALSGVRAGGNLYVNQDDARFHSVLRGWAGSLRVNYVD